MIKQTQDLANQTLERENGRYATLDTPGPAVLSPDPMSDMEAAFNTINDFRDAVDTYKIEARALGDLTGRPAKPIANYSAAEQREIVEQYQTTMEAQGRAVELMLLADQQHTAARELIENPQSSALSTDRNVDPTVVQEYIENEFYDVQGSYFATINPLNNNILMPLRGDNSKVSEGLLRTSENPPSVERPTDPDKITTF